MRNELKNWLVRSGEALVLAAALSWSSEVSAASPVRPQITSIHLEKAEVVVNVQVPPGITKVAIEGRSRLGAGAWEPKAVTRLDGNGGEVVFRLAASAEVEMLRVRADEKERLPAAFYQGTNNFAGLGGGGGAVFDGALNPNGGAPTPNRNATATEGASRDVTESDIWKIQGSTLYFFNQSRGLQIIDLTTPDSPILRGKLDMAAVGEQMYVLPGGEAVLLARDGCDYVFGQAQSHLHVVKVVNGVPAIAATLPVQGTIQESRMVGSALYLVSQQYQERIATGNSTYEWGSVISSFDLSDPVNPKVKDTLWYPGWGNVITATDRFLFVATQDTGNWWRSIVHCVDIAAPDGAMKALSSIKLDGRVPDKFKIHLNRETLTVISENWNTSGRGVFTSLETFSLSNPLSPERLGNLILARGEQLHATRFDGDRVYVVTFLRIDPLWIVDLSDPRQPQIVGELHVPGWSTYIQPLGNQLVSIGIDNSNSWKVAVSLFDVTDASRPTLLDKVALGENYSWSEANYDEKAFSVLPESGTILVPYQGDQSGGYASRVQIIDLGATTLKARGKIEHQMQPRRATVHGDRILSVDAHELVVVDAADRDRPVVKAALELAWPVNKVFLRGDHLLEISQATSWWFGGQVGNSIRVALAQTPDLTIGRIGLDSDLPILGSDVRDGRLYVLQGTSAQVEWVPPATEGGDSTTTTKKGKFVLSIFELGALPVVTRIGVAEDATEQIFYGEFSALWPRSDLLVWSGGGSTYWLWDAGITRRGGLVADSLFFRPWGGGGGGLLLGVTVSDAAAPKFVSTTRLASNNWWSQSEAFAADGLIYSSHQTSEFLEGVNVPGQTTTGPAVTAIDPITGKENTVTGPSGIWTTRYFLDVIDYADASLPTVRKPVSIPGTLRGLSHDGAVVYTVGPHWKSDWTTDWTEWLDASAYDGVSASLVASLPLNDWPHPLLVKDGNVFVGRAKTEKLAAALEVWTLADSGRFSLIHTTPLDSSIQELAAFGNLLATLQDQKLSLFDASDPAQLRSLGGGRPAGCLWYQLKNADGTAERGLWLPLNEYGVAQIPVKPVVGNP